MVPRSSSPVRPLWRRAVAGLLLATLLAGTRAADECAAPDAGRSPPAAGPPEAAGPRHHPTGTPLPGRGAGKGFRQPDRCVGDVWFFDADRNGRLDAAEVRLFGTDRRVECGSCHGESPTAKSEAAASTFLRIDPEGSALCLVCHEL